MNQLEIVGRVNSLLEEDVELNKKVLKDMIKNSKILVIGGAGSIGQAVSLEIFMRDPKVLHIVDISENNLVELVRSIRSKLGYSTGEFKTFALDSDSIEFRAMLANSGNYDYVFNLSALKHVRSEKDPFTLMRMTCVNIFNTIEALDLTSSDVLRNYFCVSTDKAANPVNLMGASKRIMEMFLMKKSSDQNISMARFANVAFSDGSLLHGFNQRMSKGQPISAPRDIRRYFMTQKEAGQLCLLSGILGENRDIFFPKLNEELGLITFSEIARKFVNERGFQVHECETEEEARCEAENLIKNKLWPCYFFESDTTGEKPFEEFFTSNERINNQKFKALGVIKNEAIYIDEKLEKFKLGIENLKKEGSWSKLQIVNLYKNLVPEFEHAEKGKNLDQRM